ncbi:hypothetical protein [Streptomyces sp. NPDC048192]|jgi:hypothetical protein
MPNALAPEETVEQDIELVDLGDLVDELYSEAQVERPGVICETA